MKQDGRSIPVYRDDITVSGSRRPIALRPRVRPAKPKSCPRSRYPLRRQRQRPCQRRPAARNAASRVTETTQRRRVYVYPTSPTPTVGSGIDVDKVPASINAVDAAQIERTGSLNIADALQQQVPGIIINDATGNPFQPDMQFRGFVASPVAGTPQGLAVYQNGVRINEAFGDTVNWDLIPTAAIRSVTVVTNNPAFGLNALGGAVNVQMKDGFNYQGRRDQHDGRLVRTHPGLGAMGQTGRQYLPSMARSKACTTTAFAIFRNRTSAASMAMSATGTRAANFTSIWASPTTISAQPRRCRSNCCSIIGARPTPRRRPPPTASAMSI